MNTKSFLWIILNSIFLIIFNAFFFVVGGIDHKISVWISYGFIHFAYFMLLLVPMLIRGGRSGAVFGFSLYSVSSIYFLVEFFTGVFFILIALNGYKAALLIQLCIAGFYGIALVSNMITNELTADAEEKRQDQIAFVKNASTKLKGLLESVGDKEVKKKIEKVYDAVYSSPVKSHPDLAQMEDHILKSIRAMGDMIADRNLDAVTVLVASLEAEICERNRRLKAYN